MSHEVNDEYFEPLFEQLEVGIEREKQRALDERTRQIVAYLQRSPSMCGAARRIAEVFAGLSLDAGNALDSAPEEEDDSA